jgi:hypothetical protein
MSQPNDWEVRWRITLIYLVPCSTIAYDYNQTCKMKESRSCRCGITEDRFDIHGSVHNDTIITKMTNKMQLCRIIYCSLTALHVSSGIIAHHQERLSCNYSFWFIHVCRCRLLITTLVDFQLDVQNSYLFIYNTLIKILNMFWALPCSSSGGLRRNCIYAASGIVSLCRWLSCAPAEK